MPTVTRHQCVFIGIILAGLLYIRLLVTKTKYSKDSDACYCKFKNKVKPWRI